MCKYTKDYVPKLALLMCVQIHKTVKFLKHVHVCKTHSYTNCYVSYFMLMCLTLCEYANILLMRRTCSLLGFFVFYCDTLGVQVIHVINLYHNDKNHDWINWKKEIWNSVSWVFKLQSSTFRDFINFLLRFWHWVWDTLTQPFALSLFLPLSMISWIIESFSPVWSD